MLGVLLSDHEEELVLEIKNGEKQRVHYSTEAASDTLNYRDGTLSRFRSTLTTIFYYILALPGHYLTPT